MQGDKAVIAMLNKVLTWELTSINQYFCMPACTVIWGLMP